MIFSADVGILGNCVVCRRTRELQCKEEDCPTYCPTIYIYIHTSLVARYFLLESHDIRLDGFGVFDVEL